MKALFSAEAALLALLAALHLVIFFDGINSDEEWSYYLGARSLVEHRNLDLGEDYESSGLAEIVKRSREPKRPKKKIPGTVYEPGPPEGVPVEPEAPAPFDIGATYPVDAKSNPSSSPELGRGTHVAPGSFFADAPFYLLGRWMARRMPMKIETGNRVFNALSYEETTKVIVVLFGHMVFTVLAVLVLYATFVLLGYSRTPSALGAALLFFATPLAQYGGRGFPHGASALALALAVHFIARLALLDERKEESSHLGAALLVGLFVGAATALRYLNALVLPGVLVYLILMRRSWKDAIVRSVALLVGFALLAWTVPYWWRLTYGRLTYPYLSEAFRLRLLYPVPLRKVLLLEHNGLLVFAPIVALGIAGAVHLGGVRKNNPAAWYVMLASIITFGLMALVVDANVNWTGGGFSSRLMTGASLLVGLGVVHLMSESYNRWAPYVAAFAAALYSYTLFIIYRAHLFPRWVMWRADGPEYIQYYQEVFRGKNRYLWHNLSGQIYNKVYTIRQLIVAGRVDILVGALLVLMILLHIALMRLERRSIETELEEHKKILAQQGGGFVRRGV